MTLIDDSLYKEMYEKRAVKYDKIGVVTSVIILILFVAFALGVCSSTGKWEYLSFMLVPAYFAAVYVMIAVIILMRKLKKRTYLNKGYLAYANFETMGLKVPVYDKKVGMSMTPYVEYMLLFENNQVAFYLLGESAVQIDAFNDTDIEFEFYEDAQCFKMELLDSNIEMMMEKELQEPLIEYLMNHSLKYKIIA